VVRRVLPGLAETGENDVAGVFLGVLAAIYGIVLAFVIVTLFEDFRKAGGASAQRRRRSPRSIP
jgi:hypothetical protein